MKLFPHVHSVLAVTVSSPCRSRKKVLLSNTFDAMRGISSIPLGVENEAFHNPDHHESESNDDLNDVSNNAGDDNDGDALEPVEQYIYAPKGSTILEFFLAMIRLHSQNAVGWWPIVAPLAHYAKEHSMNLPKHPLHGSGANVTWQNSQLSSILQSLI